MARHTGAALRHPARVGVLREVEPGSLVAVKEIARLAVVGKFVALTADTTRTIAEPSVSPRVDSRHLVIPASRLAWVEWKWLSYGVPVGFVIGLAVDVTVIHPLTQADFLAVPSS